MLLYDVLVMNLTPLFLLDSEFYPQILCRSAVLKGSLKLGPRGILISEKIMNISDTHG